MHFRGVNFVSLFSGQIKSQNTPLPFFTFPDSNRLDRYTLNHNVGLNSHETGVRKKTGLEIEKIRIDAIIKLVDEILYSFLNKNQRT